MEGRLLDRQWRNRWIHSNSDKVFWEKTTSKKVKTCRSLAYASLLSLPTKQCERWLCNFHACIWKLIPELCVIGIITVAFSSWMLNYPSVVLVINVETAWPAEVRRRTCRTCCRSTGEMSGDRRRSSCFSQTKPWIFCVCFCSSHERI